MTCDLNHSEDQRQILDAAAALLDASFPIGRAAGADLGKMGEIAEFGAFSLALDAEAGGAGFTLVEEVLLHALFGRHVVSTRVLAAPLAARIAHEIGLGDLANDIAAGATPVCAAFPAGDTLRLIDGEGAKLAVVFSGRRIELIALEGVAVAPVTGLGHDVALTEIPAAAPERLGASNSAAILHTADLLISAQLLGIAEGARDLAVAYAGVRRQFGRQIGSFQAIKHHCANMAIAAEKLSALLDMASIAVRDGRSDAAFQVASTRLIAPQSALANARLCIQIHGGIGFSAEASAHRYLKQAHVLRQLGTGAAILDLSSPMAPLKTD